MNETPLADQALSAFNNKDAEALRNLLTENAEHIAAGSSFGSRIYGRDAIARYFGNVFSKFKSLNFSIVKSYYYADAQIVEWAGNFVTSGSVTYDNKGVIIFDVEDGGICAMREYFDTERTRQAFENGTGAVS